VAEPDRTAPGRPATSTTEFHLFLPQMRLSPAALAERVRAAEAAGFAGVALMDHLVPPNAEDQPMLEAMVTATWLAARTERLSVGHLVLCDAFRHPAILAKQAVTLDHVSEGRFELAIGSGSVPAEYATFGFDTGKQATRTRRLGETLEVITQLWTGEPVTYHGEFHHLERARQLPVPTRPIPIVIGGSGPTTMELVARFADWWNLPVHQVSRLEDLRSRAGSARVSMQQVVTLVPSDGSGQAIMELAQRRFGWAPPEGRAIGSGSELVDRFGELRDRGVERFYLWLTDFAPPETLAAFGDEVIAPLR
jgi:alkanesulfonate monooxygenase SsuD/methylene tetrahydromethanopterin reductase-like flavin-dependent oxidoreductase (luciferase family)